MAAGELMEMELGEESTEEMDDGLDSDDGVILEERIDTRHQNKRRGFATGIDIFSEEERKKMQERAKRFGLSNNLEENEDGLYSSLGVTEDNENPRNIRLNVLHMRGTEEMSTKDVFKYFEQYPAAAIEWINDVSCNVVWLDNVSAARALLGLSKRIIGLTDHLEEQEKGKYTHEDDLVKVNDTKNEGICLKDIDCPLPPGLWRKGVDFAKSKGIFLRFATRNDKKQPRAEKMSEYYKKYGNPNFGGMRGILTESRKRQYKQIKNSRPRRPSETSGNEEDKERGKNPWGELSESWGSHEDVEDNYVRRGLPERLDRGNVKFRLGSRHMETEKRDVQSSPEESQSSDSEEEWARKSKVPRMRMHADDEEEKVRKKKLKQLSRHKQEEGADLRSRLGRRRPPTIYREDIQVIVTNTPDKYRARREEDVEEVAPEEVEKEEGEWEDVQGDAQVVEEEEEEEDEEEESSSDSEIAVKEIQGPKGSVIKVVPRSKPRVASTVWARLNDTSRESGNPRKLTDLRTRLGLHKRERSPLRIEVKNEKYEKRNDSE
ncbi:uncharacterized protein C17orf85 [Fopius arisanus]|uniref:Nuclear cap-binding protein subunit 3 n=2 Tax=Fopius arisanus TaxID=64838 RepID=A0A9R1TH07_9HYME|nr:PREDICTED: uncharacterized protein C17orf85-like [Fopius arisanus]